MSSSLAEEFSSSSSSLAGGVRARLPVGRKFQYKSGGDDASQPDGRFVGNCSEMDACGVVLRDRDT